MKCWNDSIEALQNVSSISLQETGVRSTSSTQKQNDNRLLGLTERACSHESEMLKVYQKQMASTFLFANGHIASVHLENNRTAEWYNPVCQPEAFRVVEMRPNPVCEASCCSSTQSSENVCISRRFTSSAVGTFTLQTWSGHLVISSQRWRRISL